MHRGESVVIEIVAQLAIVAGINVQESGEPVLGLQDIEIDEVEQHLLQRSDALRGVYRYQAQNDKERDVTDETPEYCDESGPAIISLCSALQYNADADHAQTEDGSSNRSRLLHRFQFNSLRYKSI